MTWKNVKVLVTGAGGFIGSHLVERLLELGADVRAFVRYNSRNSWGWLDEVSETAKSAVEVITGDIADRERVELAMRGREVVFHLAALIGIPYSYEAPESYVRTNVTGTLNVLMAALRAGVSRVVHTSTSEVYGTAQYTPVDESHPLQAQSPYSATKIAGDMLAESFYRSFGLPVAVVRPFNTYGPRQSLRAVVPTIILQALAGGPVRLGSLHPTRDLTFVKDTVEGFLRVGEHPAAIGRVTNIGSGFEISVYDLVREIGAVLGVDLVVVQEEERIRPTTSEVERLLCDNRRAIQELGWWPRYSLREGLEETIAWFRAHAARYKLGMYHV